MSHRIGHRIGAVAVGLLGSVIEAVPLVLRLGWPLIFAGCLLCFGLGAFAGVWFGSGRSGQGRVR